MEQNREFRGHLEAYARSVGFDLFGVASAERFVEAERALVERIDRGLLSGLGWFTADRARFCADPRNHLPEVRSIISLGVSYLSTEADSRPPREPTNGETDPPRGRVARYAWGRDYHQEIGQRLRLVADWLAEHSPAAGRPKVFVDHGRMIDRAAARRAGLGWYGKNTNILTRTHGSFVFLAEILTNLDLQPDRPVRTTCGSCRRCLDACPTGALIAPGVLDSDRCISFLTIELRGWIPRGLRQAVGDWIFGCDVCQEVCPVNVKARPGIHPEYAAERGLGAAPELLPLLETTETSFGHRFRGTPILRTGRQGLVRNAAIALGNRGGAGAVTALGRALGDSDPVVRGHAAWALGRIGGHAARELLRWRFAAESDPEALAEIRLALG